MTRSKVDTKELLKSLSLEEKIGQLLQLGPSFFKKDAKEELTGPMTELGISEEDIDNAGTVLGISGAEEMIEIQKSYLEKSRHKIPLIFMADVVHGYRTVFPVPLALGCTWDEEICEMSARVSAKEAAAGGVQVTFSPMVDLVRDPRWGRVMESTGEDPFLNSFYARAFVRGYQGDDISKEDNIGACVKHFAAYGAPEGGRDYNTVDISERMLREFYLPPYRAAIEEGCKLVMTSFNVVNSIPASGNTWLLRDVLRKEWNFNGTVISDFGAVKEMVPHGAAEDEKEAGEKAITAGVDIEMMTTCYSKYLKELVEEGKVKEELIDEAVLNILNLKKELGLFEDPYKGASEEKAAQLNLCSEHRAAARKAAVKASVLLKNDGTLPIKKDVSKVAIIGPLADDHSIIGAWSVFGRFEDAVSLKEGMINKLGEDRVVIYSAGTVKSTSDEEMEAALKAAEGAEVVILALGEDESMSGEGASRAFITLPGRQQELAEKIFALNKKTAVVLFNGRPLDITELYKKAPAILEAWHPGTEGGNAVCDILFGDENPSGKLSMSFPYTVGQVPVYYNAFNTGRPYKDNERYCSHYTDIPNEPLLPFGYGLSYSKFQYSNIKLSSSVLSKEGSITASLKVKNISSLDGEEVVQLYIRDITASVVRPVKELKAFKKIQLKAGEEKEISFEINEEMLKFYNSKCEFVSEKGKFNVMIGPNSGNVEIREFELI